jgi:tRNA pseudouridine55 synthase
VDGFINLNKPAGLTSHDCVARVRRILKTKKVGHGGTLDPAATGVLPIAIGKATRLLSYLPEGKSYRALIKFGIQTSTDDLEGEVLHAIAVPELTLEKIRSILPQFIGKIQQIPPMYSAIQIDGQRLYKLARAGETIEIPPREVEIKAIEIINWQPGDFPELELDINCGGGTYIRSIARDLGLALSSHGTLSQLVRTSSCGFNLDDSIILEDLATDRFVPISPQQGLAHLPQVLLIEPDLIKRWSQGQVLAIPSSTQGIHLVLGIGDILLGLGSVAEDLLIPRIVTCN